jgi:xanthine dehydrogenase accessory factor
VAVLERGQPLAVRRLVSFAEAVLSGRAQVEGVAGRRVEPASLEEALAEGGFVPVTVDPDAHAIGRLRPAVVVDGRMLKGARDGDRPAEALLVALGPGYTAGRDADAVVETQRGPELGRVVWSGMAQPDTAVPAAVLGFAYTRVVRAPRAGTFRAGAPIGALVAEGEAVGAVDGERVLARIGGLLRGLLADGVAVEVGTKIGDIDPRGRSVDPALVSDKARAVAAGVLEAVTIGLARRR